MSGPLVSKTKTMEHVLQAALLDSSNRVAELSFEVAELKSLLGRILRMTPDELAGLRVAWLKAGETLAAVADLEAAPPPG